jgi:hypothetical protein
VTARRRRVAVGVGLLVVGFAASYGYAPALVPAAIRRTAEGVVDRLDPGLTLLLIGAVVGVLGLLYAWVSRRDGTAPMPDRTGSADRRTAVAGAELTIHHERTVAGHDRTATDPLRDRLRAAVVTAYRDGQNGDGTTVVDAGTWTDDRYAAAFLTTTDAVDYPWYHRLYAWLYPERAYDRRVGRTLGAVERLCDERVAGYDPPERPPGPPDRTWRRLRAALEASS